MRQKISYHLHLSCALTLYISLVRLSYPLTPAYVCCICHILSVLTLCICLPSTQVKTADAAPR